MRIEQKGIITKVLINKEIYFKKWELKQGLKGF